MQLWGEPAGCVPLLIGAAEHIQGQHEGVDGIHLASCARASTAAGAVTCCGVSSFSKGEPDKADKRDGTAEPPPGPVLNTVLSVLFAEPLLLKLVPFFSKWDSKVMKLTGATTGAQVSKHPLFQVVDCKERLDSKLVGAGRKVPVANCQMYKLLLVMDQMF